MASPATPRAMIRAMLQGEPPPRPLLLPIVFGLGARLENLTLGAYRTNPTKIANALRQLRGVLGLDGVSCYFDPYLEGEALGCEFASSAAGFLRHLLPLDGDGGLQGRLQSPEEVSGRGRIPVACDVLQRLKAMLPGEPALMAGVTGPRTLAAQLREGVPDAELATTEMLELAAGVTAAVCKSFLEAGANVIFLGENPASIADYREWAELLSPIVNIIRFYEALPVLLFRGAPPVGPTPAGRSCEGLVCPGLVDFSSRRVPHLQSSWPAACLSSTCFFPSQVPDHLDDFLQVLSRDANLCLLTSDGDVPPVADVKYLATLLGRLRSLPRAPV